MPLAAPSVPRYAWRPVSITALTLAALLVATANRYGYHRDELYFLAAGRHLAWGYDDQPVLVPLISRLMDALAPDNLVLLRTPSALAMAATVLLVAAIAREMGADGRAQTLAALVSAGVPMLVYNGHLLSTTTFDVFFGTVLVWLLARWIRTGQDRLLLGYGLVAGIALHNKTLIAFLAAALVLGQPRVLRRPAFWAGAAIALAIWAPNLWWQAQHDWPQFDMADVIRAEEPGGGRILLVPMQFLLFGPITAAIWLVGLWRLFRTEFRGFAVSYLVLLGTFLVLGGQVYYLSGGYPALIAAGSIAVLDWIRRGARRWRTGLVAAAVALNALSTIAVSLPVYPVDAVGSAPPASANDDSLETVGWPEFVGAVRSAYRGLPEPDRAGAVVFTTNYGEAGAIERYGPDLPPVYSGHNAYWRWGPPAEGNRGPVLAVGDFGTEYLGQRFGSVELVGRFDNGFDVDNEEQGAGIWICREPRGTWSELWPGLRHLG